MSLIAERINERKALRPMSSTAGAVSYQIIGGSLVPIQDNSVSYIKQGYNINDVIFSIVNLILDKVKLAPWAVYEIVDERSLKSLHAITSKHDMNAEDMRIAKHQHTKALKPAKNPGKWGELIQYPNEQDTWQDFVGNGAGYKMLTGNKYVWADMLKEGRNSGFPHELWQMPSHFVQILATTGFPSRVIAYQLPVLARTDKQRYEKEEVLHEKYYNYDYSVNGSHLSGMAPLRAGLRLNNRSNSALDASTAKFQNGGLETIIYLDEDGANKTDGMASMAALKQKLIHEYSGPNNAGKIAASGYKVGAINLGLSPVELNIIEAEKWDLRRFCNVLGGVPSQLLNDPENKTYNNQKEGEKALTSRCALSHLSSFRSSLNRQARENWGLAKNQILDYDITVFSELQEDMKEMVDWVIKLAQNTGLSPNRVLDLLGLEKQSDSAFDEPWIRTEMGQPMSEWSMNEVDNELNK